MKKTKNSIILIQSLVPNLTVSSEDNKDTNAISKQLNSNVVNSLLLVSGCILHLEFTAAKHRHSLSRYSPPVIFFKVKILSYNNTDIGDIWAL